MINWENPWGSPLNSQNLEQLSNQYQTQLDTLNRMKASGGGVLEEINNLGTTIIMATHDKEMVNRMKKRVILIEAGKLKEDYEKGTYNHEAA